MVSDVFSVDPRRARLLGGRIAVAEIEADAGEQPTGLTDQKVEVVFLLGPPGPLQQLEATVAHSLRVAIDIQRWRVRVLTSNLDHVVVELLQCHWLKSARRHKSSMLAGLVCGHGQLPRYLPRVGFEWIALPCDTCSIAKVRMPAACAPRQWRAGHHR